MTVSKLQIKRKQIELPLLTKARNGSFANHIINVNSCFKLIKNHNYETKKGFSLIEIVLSLLVLSTSLAIIFSGFEISANLNNHARFESEAAFLAEREMELAKSELLNGNIIANKKVRKIESRFRLKPGWKLFTLILPPDEENAVRLQVRVTHTDRELQLESFLFLPNQEVHKNG